MSYNRDVDVHVRGVSSHSFSRCHLQVLGSYRRLLRACRGVFQRDQHALLASRARVRGEFCKNRLETDREQVAKVTPCSVVASSWSETDPTLDISISHHEYRSFSTQP